MTVNPTPEGYVDPYAKPADVTLDDVVEPDPKRPYKAYAAAAGAAIGALLDLALPMPAWLTATLVVLAAGLGAFVTPNPLKRKGEEKPKRKNRRTKAAERRERRAARDRVAKGGRP